MARFELVGGDYGSQSPTADVQKTENLYVEALDPQSKSAKALFYTPGLAVTHALGETNRLNGSLTINGRMFQAAGTHLYELFANGTFVARFAIANDNQPVSMAAAQVIAGQGTPQLAIVSAGQLYVMNLLSNVAVTNPTGFDGTPFQIVYVDGFYVLLNTNGVFQFSAPFDATTWPGIETQATTSYPDQTVAIAANHRQLFTLSILKGTTYYNAGDQPIPFDEVSGGDFEQGTGSPWSLVALDNTLFFIGQNKEGAGVAWRLNGYTPQRISTHAIEFAWQGYSTIADVVCYGYQDQGHTFYVCYFPTANITWVYDVATNLWHRRTFWNAAQSKRTAHRSCSHAYCFGKHLVADWASGNVYQMSIANLTDFGNYIKRIRRAPHISNENEYMFYNQLQVDVETGLTPGQLLTGNGTPTFYTLQDSASNLWNVGISDVGVLQTRPAAFSGAQPLYLSDPTGATSWQVQVNTFGVISTTRVTLSPTYQQILQMYSSTGTSRWNVTVNALGILQTQFVATVYRNPEMTLRYSKDGGHTWFNWGVMDCGAPGNFKARAMARRMGYARDMVFELEMTDPYPWRLVDAFLKARGAGAEYAPTERLTDRARKMA